jgi:hypothetical protein
MRDSKTIKLIKANEINNNLSIGES